CKLKEIEAMTCMEYGHIINIFCFHEESENMKTKKRHFENMIEFVELYPLEQDEAIYIIALKNSCYHQKYMDIKKLLSLRMKKNINFFCYEIECSGLRSMRPVDLFLRGIACDCLANIADLVVNQDVPFEVACKKLEPCSYYEFNNY
ncbi:MAG: hypothetical protein HQK51_21635, partial [Oligoflexia bacterium]|nr:hypothetical protein [Oligoflexia bacterium]